MSEPRRTQIGGPLITEEGMMGVFTREQATGAIPNGARIRKIDSEDGDSTPDGTEGTVLGSLAVPDELLAQIRADQPDYPDTDYSYFVEWDNKPKLAVGTMDFKIEEAT